MRLFCFAHAGGSSAAFRAWSRSLPRAIEVSPVELPGHGRRIAEPLHTRMRPIVDDAVAQILPRVDGGYALFGHSLGGLVAFEVARALRHRAAPPAIRLVVAATAVPGTTLGGLAHGELSDDRLVDEIARLGGPVPSVARHRGLLQPFLAITRADFEVAERYAPAPEPPLDCPLTAFGGTRDPFVGPEALLGWRAETNAGFRRVLIDGDHFFPSSAADFLGRLAEEVFPNVVHGASAAPRDETSAHLGC